MVAKNIGLEKSQTPPMPQPVLQRFIADQHGSLTILTLILFVLMVFMGGLAIDLMRYEQTRTALQNTLDRATLASASLTQTLDPESVVNDYFDKAGMSQYLDSVVVTEGLNYRTVEADATASTNPFFLHMLTSDQKINAGAEKPKQLLALGHSMAEQRVNNVEIALVLDVSGSMGNNNKLVNLKSAAKEFVQTVMSSDAESKIAISLVPFNGQVNLGTDLKAKFTGLYNDPNYTNVNCVDMPTSVYTTTGIATNAAMSMTAHADTYSSTNKTNGYVNYTDTNYGIGYDSYYNALNVWCPPLANNIVRLPQRDITTLQGYIQNLTAVGATSINAGMKWGLTMMDPTLRTAFTEFRLAGKIPSELVDRPFDYTDKEAMKVIVLMTDGEHFAQSRVQEAYKSGPSTIWRSDDDGYYSVYLANGQASSTSNPRYYVPYTNTWQATPYAKVTQVCTTSGSGKKKVTTCNDVTGNATQQTWPQVWAAMRVSYVAWQFYGRPLGGSNSSNRTYYYNQAMDAFVTSVDTGTMDDQLQTMCGLAKTNGVIVYGIAFEAPTNGQTQISKCATSSAHYFNAQGLQISTAFRSIASNISQLRLTQ
jgi:Flp pilus assembly protein TadG